MARRRAELKSRGIDMTPVIDVIFQLLIFFMVTTVFAVQSGLKINLPEAKNVDETKQKDLVINISANDEMDLNGKSINISSLSDELRVQKDIFGTKNLIIKADKRTLHGTVIEVMDIAKSIGINQIALATEEKKSE